MKNVLIIASGFRLNGNSNSLAKEFARGASDSGNKTEIIYLADKQLAFCRGCLACQKLHKCVVNDDANEIALKMKNSDILVFATPVYYYSISGQLKTLFDRVNQLYYSDYRYTDVYLLTAAAEDDEHTADGAITAVQGWIDCFERARLAGVIFAGGVNSVGDIIGHPTLTEAYKAGKALK